MAAAEGEYALKRDTFASIRLLTQHWLWKDHWGWNLWPGATKIQFDNGHSKSMKIADIACGTGIWLLEEAHRNPSNLYHGFDISSAQFPSSHHLPKNVILGTMNIMEPVPKEYNWYFDIVHVRLLIPATRTTDPRPILHNLLSLLKPGGLLQWDEVVPEVKTLGRPPHWDTNHVSMVERILNPQLKKVDSLRELPNMLLECKMQNVECLKSGEPSPAMWKFWGDNMLVALEESLRRPGASEDEANRLIALIQREMETENTFPFMEMMIVVGFKKKNGFE